METAISSLKYTPLLCLALFAGCKSDTLQDPNDPFPQQLVSGEILSRNIDEMMRTLDNRARIGEIPPEQRDEIVKREVKKMLANVAPEKIPAKQAWQFGDAYRLAGDWPTALKLYMTAVHVAKTHDRIVNDNLRLARVQAHMGQVDEAVKSCRSTFTVDAQDKAPILLAVLYEVLPEAVGKGKDQELAKLLEDSIAQHQAVIVDATSKAGKDFLLARPAHVHNAWIRIARLYQSLGMDKEARDAILKDEEDRRRSGFF